MPYRSLLLLRVALVAVLAGSASACLAAAAGAGAAGAVAYENRGAESLAQGSINAVFDRAVAAFAATGVGQTGQTTEDNGAKRKLVGSRGDLEVTVDMERESDTTTKVTVTARRNTVEYDRDFARDLLGRIVGGS